MGTVFAFHPRTLGSLDLKGSFPWEGSFYWETKNGPIKSETWAAPSQVGFLIPLKLQAKQSLKRG